MKSPLFFALLCACTAMSVAQSSVSETLTVKTIEKEQLNSIRWYIDCGDDDFLYEGNAKMHILIRQLGVNHEYRVRDGGHTWDYWRTALPTVLEFISKGFHQF